MRFRKRVILLQSTGTSSRKYAAPQKYCQNGFSRQVRITHSSDKPYKCFRYCKPIIRRMGLPGQPVLSRYKTTKASSYHHSLGIWSASWHSAWCSSRMFSSRDWNRSPFTSVGGLCGLIYRVRYCKECIYNNTRTCNFRLNRLLTIFNPINYLWTTIVSGVKAEICPFAK